ncbi:MAG TPA: hypothetical protein VK737_09315 [Opitutales bacterium]|nr:hypothetical protein [Opitutales bacterium]
MPPLDFKASGWLFTYLTGLSGELEGRGQSESAAALKAAALYASGDPPKHLYKVQEALKQVSMDAIGVLSQTERDELAAVGAQLDAEIKKIGGAATSAPLAPPTPREHKSGWQEDVYIYHRVDYGEEADGPLAEQFKTDLRRILGLYPDVLKAYLPKMGRRGGSLTEMALWIKARFGRNPLVLHAVGDAYARISPEDRQIAISFFPDDRREAQVAEKCPPFYIQANPIELPKSPSRRMTVNYEAYGWTAPRRGIEPTSETEA